MEGTYDNEHLFDRFVKLTQDYAKLLLTPHDGKREDVCPTCGQSIKEEDNGESTENDE